MSVDILIVAHSHDEPLQDSKYTIAILVGLWRQMGFTVDVEPGSSRFPATKAAVAINHVNLTITPARYLNYLRRFPTVINGGLTDISKSKYCRHLLSSEHDHDGPVIVKTNLNFGGIIEDKLRRRQENSGLAPELRSLPQWLEGGTSSPDPAAIDPHTYPTYPIYDHPSLVPVEVWRNPYFVVQPFQPELERGGLHRLRSWYVFGDRGFHVTTVAKEPIVKGCNIIDRWVTNIITPPEMEALRREMHVDYGRFDYVMVGGKPVVYDINRTPTSSPGAVVQYASQWCHLAEGIATFLGSKVAHRRAIELKPDLGDAHRQLSVILAQQERQEEALAAAQRALACTPDNAGLHHHLGKLLQRWERLDEAKAAFRRAIELKPDLGDAHRQLSVILAQQERQEEALAAAQRALACTPDNAGLHHHLGKLLQRWERLDEAKAAFRRAIELKPDLGDAYRQLSVILAQQERQEEALAAAQRALACTPDNAGLHHHLGKLLQRWERLDEAKAAFRRAIELKPDLGDAHRQLSVILAQQERQEEALAAAQRALACTPDNAGLHHHLGKLLQRWERLDEAKAAFRRAIELKPDLGDAHRQLSVILAQQERQEEALAAAQRALACTPDNAGLHHHLGKLLQRWERLDEAKAAFRRAIELKPDLGDAYRQLSVILAQQERQEEALAAAQRALACTPDNAGLHHHLGKLLQRWERLDEAKAAFRRAIELKPDLGDAHRQLSVILAQQERQEEALAAAQRALACTPDNAGLHHHLGKLLQRWERLDEAKAAFRRAIELKPDLGDAHRQLSVILAQQERQEEALAAARNDFTNASFMSTRPSHPTNIVEGTCLTELDQKWIAFSRNCIKEDRFLIGIETDDGHDEIYFSVPIGFYAHNDSVAAALATLCGKKYQKIRFKFPLSRACRQGISEQTSALVTSDGTGTRRRSGRNIALNFSGGFDSLASYFLAPQQIRVAVAFGSWFERERAFFETLSPEVICTTDFRQKGYERNDWLFMFASSLLYADYLDLAGVGMGTIFEATSYNYRFSKHAKQIPLFEAIGLQEITLTRGLTEFGTAQLMLRYGPELIDQSIHSLAEARSEKSLRKRLMIDTMRQRDGGPPPDFDTYEYPNKKPRYGESFPIDFLALSFVRLYGLEIVSRWVDGLDRIDLELLDKIDVSWIYRHNPLFLEDIPPDLRPDVMRRMEEAGIESFHRTDWPHYRALRKILAEFHPFPVEDDERITEMVPELRGG